MDLNEFIGEWYYQWDVYDRKRTVGIGVNWNSIAPNSFVTQVYGEEAWNTMGGYYAPLWGGFNRTILSEWLNPSRDDYEKFVTEERKKIELYRDIGLQPNRFCAFSDLSGKIGVLGDGNHRYIDFNHLIREEPTHREDTRKTRLDILHVNNLHEVLSQTDLPPNYASSS